MNEGRTSRPPAGNLHLAVIVAKSVPSLGIWHGSPLGTLRRRTGCGPTPGFERTHTATPAIDSEDRGAVPAVVVPTATVTHRSSSMAKPA